LRLVNRRFATPCTRPIISVAVVAVIAVGLAIALPAAMAASHRTAGSGAAPDQPKRNLSRAFAQAKAAAGRPAGPGAGCLVSYTPTNWPGAFTVTVTIGNRGTTRINGWTLTFAFPGDQTISSAWNAGFTQTDARVSATNTTYDAVIAPGARQSLGFLGAWTSNDTAPTSFRVNGKVCS
jgi:type II secretory pathway pseudopilin PulG